MRKLRAIGRIGSRSVRRLPDVKHPSWVRNPIDRFVLSRLEREGLTPSREASRETLIRRVSLDLIGLPPSIEQVNDFVADRQPERLRKGRGRAARFSRTMVRNGHARGSISPATPIRMASLTTAEPSGNIGTG